MPKPPVGVASWRQLVQKRVDGSSLRAVATEIGMSSSGLHVFLGGSRPHPATLKKISAWAAREQAGQLPIDSRDVEAAVALLVRFVESAPNERQATARLRSILVRLGR
jgi:hypothetical protein